MIGYFAKDFDRCAAWKETPADTPDSFDQSPVQAEQTFEQRFGVNLKKLMALFQDPVSRASRWVGKSGLSIMKGK
jgi:hypothetical protein